MKRGEFPQPVKLGTRLVAWRESDITEWLESRETRGVYGAAPCPVCQPEGHKAQNALTLHDGADGRLLCRCYLRPTGVTGMTSYV